ncbi:alpha/beta fold hydrolase [Verrucomicrobium sp. BvORR106]|uniref:alpha/beta fold hydrolase n=1 Tax=Verrucomicrobium sp. BvORR106 TaxID=1403819 RepID=UPI000570E3F0|nr:alpha/beta fold hydrolase [Verrucomicrobium sp. BvORR106]
MSTTTDIISGFDEADLSKLVAGLDPGTASQIEDILGEASVVRLQSGAAAATRGLFERRLPAPPPRLDLPEIVLLHGITDCHLANVNGRRNRIWLDFLELIKGSFIRQLPLQSDGVSDQPGVALEPDGYVSKKYDRALAAWTQEGFRNRVFCYDWRRSVTAAADQLHTTLRNLPSVQAGEKVILVGHSMGGLVAATFAAKWGDWEDLIHHCIFVGSPLGGSYSVPMTVLGHSPSFRQMDRLAILDSLEDFQRMAASFPGLIDMLPNPELMPEAEDFYTQAGWPGGIKPQQAHLDASRALKSVIWRSPIFAKSTHIISQGHATTSSMPWNGSHTDRTATLVSSEGDGAALTKSSVVPGLKTYLATGEHGTLVNEPGIHGAIMAIATGKVPELQEYDPTRPVAATRSLPASAAAAGLSAPLIPTSGSAAIEAVREVRVGQELALHFSSETAVRARTQVAGEPGFDRSKLKVAGFSWHNALSLAIASLDAYRSHQSEMSARAKGDWGFHGYEPFDVAETQGFVSWDDDVVLLSFRGTEQKISDWLRNFNVVPEGSGRFGAVHGGFYEGYKKAEGEVKKLLAKAGAGTGAGRKKLWITGHSLGGALAAVAGAELYDSFPASGFSTYGQPKLAGEQLVEFYAAKYPGAYFRFKNNNDIVTRVPPGYDHVGKLYWFNRNGELQQEVRTRGTALSLPPEVLEKSTELTQAEFDALKARLDAAATPATRGGLALPRADYQIEGLSLIPSFGISDHSLANQYVPIIRKYV